jgi:hypothetical protein
MAKQQFPMATIAAYGPENLRATKLVVAVFNKQGEEPIALRRWFTTETDARQDPVIAAEIGEFLKGFAVKSAIHTDRIIGCPHEEGIDYPQGGICPECPFWWNVDRFTHEPKRTGPETERKVGRNEICPCGSGRKYKKCCGA